MKWMKLWVISKSIRAIITWLLIITGALIMFGLGLYTIAYREISAFSKVAIVPSIYIYIYISIGPSKLAYHSFHQHSLPSFFFFIIRNNLSLSDLLPRPHFLSNLKHNPLHLSPSFRLEWVTILIDSSL
jgi:hypothetical protein